MSEERLSTAQRVPLEWHQVWIRAVTRPSLATFEEILADPRASTNRAYKWIFVTSLISQAIMLVGSGLSKDSLYGSLDAWQGANTTFWSLICSPVIAGMAVLGFVIGVGILQWIAGRLGGSGEYEDLAMAMASYQAPIAIVSAVLAFLGPWVPFAACVGVPLGIFMLVLQVMAVKAVNRFSWERAVATILIPMGVLILIACVAAVALGSALGSLFEAGY